MVLVYKCLKGFCAIFPLIFWHISSAKWKIRKIPSYNLSIISQYWLRGIIRAYSIIVIPDFWVLSLVFFSLFDVFAFIMVLSPPSADSIPSDASSSEVLDLHPRFEGIASGFRVWLPLSMRPYCWRIRFVYCYRQWFGSSTHTHHVQWKFSCCSVAWRAAFRQEFGRFT